MNEHKKSIDANTDVLYKTFTISYLHIMMHLLDNRFKVEFSEPLPIILLPPEQMLVNVKVVQQESVAHSVNHHRNVALTVWDLQQALYILKTFNKERNCSAVI